MTAASACPTDTGLSSVFPASYRLRPARDRASPPGLPAPVRPSPPAAPTDRAYAPDCPAAAAARLGGNAPHPPPCVAWLAAVVERADTLAHRRTDVSPPRLQGGTSTGTRHISAVSSSPPTAARPAAPTAGLTFALGLIRRTHPLLSYCARRSITQRAVGAWHATAPSGSLSCRGVDHFKRAAEAGDSVTGGSTQTTGEGYDVGAAR